MAVVKCQRCGREDEDIPTHQYVKFDNEVKYLCSDCWQKFRRWYNQASPAKQSCATCGAG